VKTIVPCELRDLDGSYLLVQPVGESRCRILDSNVVPKGEIYWKPRSLDWSEASEDLGGWTRLAPSELVDLERENPVPEDENILEILEREQEVQGEHRRPELEEVLEAPESISAAAHEQDEKDFRSCLTMLADHYRSVHGYHDDQGDHLSYCVCPGLAAAAERARDHLNILISLALREDVLPPLRQLIRKARSSDGRLDLIARGSRERVA